jgi:hypothetical protein
VPNTISIGKKILTGGSLENALSDWKRSSPNAQTTLLCAAALVCDNAKLVVFQLE